MSGPRTARAKRITGARGTIKATLDFWDDQVDVYALPLRAGQTLTASLAGPTNSAEALLLWSPQTQSVNGPGARGRLTQAAKPGDRQRIAYKVPSGKSGRYFLEAKITQPGQGQYTLRFAKR